MHSLEKSPIHNKIMESIQRNVINGKSYRDAVKRAVSENRHLFDAVLDYFDEDSTGEEEEMDTSDHEEKNSSDEDTVKSERQSSERKSFEENPDTANSLFVTRSRNVDDLVKIMMG
jgi:hypothetical protein